MERVRSYLQGSWVDGEGEGHTLHDAVSGEAIATTSAQGLDLAAAMDWSRRVGGGSLRAMSFAERGAVLKRMSELCHGAREQLIASSQANYGATRGDAKFDIDGAAGTLAYYASLGRTLGDQRVVLDGEREPLMRSARFVGQHLLLPRQGVAVHINAFNFPCWGLAEKVAVALLAGVPVVAKPSNPTAGVTAQLVALWVEAGVLPEGALSLLCGGHGELLDHVGPQDCVAFTGSAATGRKVRAHPAVVAHNVRVNIEADSLNASVLGPDVTVGSDVWFMWLNDVARDITQKAGQKCTAVRRILVPEALVEAASEALCEKLSDVVMGDPRVRGTTLGPLTTAEQRTGVEAGLAELSSHCQLVYRGQVSAEGGYYVAPALFRNDAGVNAEFVHEHEVFGPVATLLPYDGSADAAIAIVAKGGGGLVCSLYSDDAAWAGPVLLGLAPWHGRLMWGSRKVAGQSPGPGTVLPNFVHGGPGKAGGGEELGGERGLRFYQQRCAIQADRGMLERVLRAL